MLRALNLVFNPDKEWEKMALSPPHILVVMLLSILPLILVTLGVEAYGLYRFGESMGNIEKLQAVPLIRILKYAGFYGAFSLVVILSGAWLLKSIGESFNLVAGYGGCLTLMAFGYSPIFLLRMADAIPGVSTWICWAIGAILSLRILYHGVAHWLKPEQTKGFGIFLVSLIYTMVLSGLVHFASVQVLRGKLLKDFYPETGPRPTLRPSAAP